MKMFLKTIFRYSQKKGLGLVEVILSMGILSIIVTSLVTLVLGSLVAIIQGSDREEAIALAKEGIEAVRSIRDRAWNENVYSQSAVLVNNGVWDFLGEGTTESIGKFTRTITFADVCRDNFDDITTCPGAYTDPHTKKVISSVSWSTRAGITNTVEEITYLTNWDSQDWTQTDWSQGSGQAIWSNPSKYDSDDGNVNISNVGQVELVSSAAGCSEKKWTFDTPGNYSYNSSKIEVVDGKAQLVGTLPSNWWDSNYQYRQQITINNNDSTTLPSGYSVNISLDHYNLVQASKSLASGDDVRIVYWDGSSYTEIDRVNETVWNTNGTNAEIWFATQSSISALSSDSGYYVYYGNAGAVNPPSDRSNIYVFYDGFESGDLSNWTDHLPDWENLILSSSADLNDWGFDVFVVGNTAYIGRDANANGGEFYVYDVTNPSSPSLLGSLEIGSDVNGVHVEGNYAYLATDSNSQELIVVDISNPASLSIVGSLNASGNQNAEDVFVSGSYAYLVRQNANPDFLVIDITTPTNPVLSGSLNFSSTINAVHVEGNYAYLATNINSSELAVVDVSTPSAPATVDTVNLSGGANALGIYVEGSAAYLTRANNSSDELYIFDITTPTSVTLIGGVSLGSNANDVYVPTNSNYAFVATDNNSNAVQVVSINDPANPVVVETFSNGADINSIYLQNDIIYTAGESTNAEFRIIEPGNYWNVATDQTNTGTYSMKAGQVTSDDRWITANGVAESDVLLEAFWRFNNNIVDISQGFRSSSNLPINQYETNLETTDGWNIAKLINGSWSELAANAGTPSTNTWIKITTIIDGQSMKVLQDGSQIVPSSGYFNVGAELSSGTIAFRTWSIPSGSSWWIDDVKLRKFTDPEPSTSLGTEEQQGAPSYPTDSPTINPTASFNPTSLYTWTSFKEVANKNGGEIYYQLSDDDGVTWDYWNGSNWVPVVGPTDYNTAIEIDANITSYSASSGKIMFKAFLTSDGSQQVQLHEVGIDCGNLQMEVGSVTVNGSWTTVNLSNSYAVPVVVASRNINHPLGFGSSLESPGTVRVRNATANSFEVRLEDPSGGIPPSRLVTYIVMEAGVWNIGGVTFEAGIRTTSTVGSASGGWAGDTVNFSANFTTPVVMHQVMSDNDPSWITSFVSSANSQTSPPGPNNMRIALNGAEVTTTHSSAEKIGWIAVEANQTGTFNGVDFETSRVPDGNVYGYDNGCYSRGYTNTYSAVPLSLGFLQEMDGNNGGWSVTCNNTTTAISITVDEDTVNDSERAHTHETMGFVAFASSFSYSSGVQATPLLKMEVGSVSIDGSWTRVNLTNSYKNPVIVTSRDINHPSGFGSSSEIPATVRVRLATSNDFEIRLENPSGASPPTRNVSYWVIEEGDWTMAGIELEAHMYSTSTVGSSLGSWTADSVNYNKSYTNPLVLHQVMSDNDPSWITSWVSSDGSRFSPPGSNSMWLGLNGAQVTASHASAEDIGYLIIEGNQTGVFNGVAFETNLIADGYIGGYDNNCYSNSYSNSYSSVPVAFGSQQKMDGGDGSWSVTCNNTTTALSLTADEDQVLDSERAHTTEAMAFVAFDSAFDYSDSGGSTGYATSGDLTSSAFDMSTPSEIQVLEWDEDLSSCTGCDIQLQVRAAPDNAGVPGTWTGWYGPNGLGTFFTEATGELIPMDLNGNQWVQYKVFLTGDGSSTPILEEVRLNFK